MADEEGFKIKGAASQQQLPADAVDPTSNVNSSSNPGLSSTPSRSRSVSKSEEAKAETGKAERMQEEGEIADEETAEERHADDVKRYRWCKCFCDPAQFGGQDHYFLQMDTQESAWEEPGQPYWIWNAEEQKLDEAGLQQPTNASRKQPTGEPDEEYYGYNPKIHGTYDPNAPYAQYHKKKREEEAGFEQGLVGGLPSTQDGAYEVAGAFNRFTGNFQSGDKSAEKHNDYNKSGRQMGAFFDVDAAANSHDGRSLKEERRNEKLTKKQVRELAEKRRAKKENKRLAFYKS
ncbi:hypothetical protein LTR37_011973 [Vermiconidia calcicola]|uniref:Uncharacterized protein n=1 Tax=Vermiconidia calcicola TaxID=1690605 RepID=A0ACC3N0G7_9PEZI|nr:hypothetical protein LTR37_011973 [Vermiconidia calcicola]